MQQLTTIRLIDWLQGFLYMAGTPISAPVPNWDTFLLKIDLAIDKILLNLANCCSGFNGLEKDFLVALREITRNNGTVDQMQILVEQYVITFNLELV